MERTKASRQAQSRERLSLVLRQAGNLISANDVGSVLGLPPGAASRLLAGWKSNGLLTRIRRGLYAPVPPSSSLDDRVLEDVWVLVPTLFSPGYVAAASAAQYWDLTEQLFRTVFVHTARPVRQTHQSTYDVSFVVRHIPTNYLFGTKAIWQGSVRIDVSDVHRTIIDMLDRPSDGGGIRHVYDCFRQYLSRRDADPETLISYADRVANGAIFKRLGFIAERAGAPSELVKACSSRLNTGLVNLDPSQKSPRVVKRWQLRVPSSWLVPSGLHD